MDDMPDYLVHLLCFIGGMFFGGAIGVLVMAICASASTEVENALED